MFIESYVLLSLLMTIMFFGETFSDKNFSKNFDFNGLKKLFLEFVK